MLGGSEPAAGALTRDLPPAPAVMARTSYPRPPQPRLRFRSRRIAAAAAPASPEPEIEVSAMVGG